MSVVYTPACDACGSPMTAADRDQTLCAKCRAKLRPPPMMALSLLQPFASLVILEEKLWETRGWRTRFRGEVAIHASGGDTYRELCDAPWFKPALARHGIRRWEDLPRGVLLGTSAITACEETAVKHWDLPTKELRFGNYADGRFCFKLEHTRRASVPVPCRGRLNFWPVPADLAIELRARLDRPARGALARAVRP